MFNNAGINKVFLVGLIGKTPRLHHHHIDQQTYYCFPLVTTEYIKKENEMMEHTEWHEIKLPAGNRIQPDIVLEKGQMIHLEGKIKTRSFIDEEGIKRYKAEIFVTNYTLLQKNQDMAGAMQ